MHETPPVIIISPDSTAADYWQEVWRFRSLAFYLAWRDVLVRYKQTVIGVAWGLLRPAITMLTFTFIFSKLANLPSGTIPYPLLVLSALLPWQLFATSITGVGESLTSNSNLISKVYFPRIVAPLSGLMVGVVDFALSLSLLAVVMVWYGVWPGWQILTLPLFVVLALLPALGFGLFLATLNVRYRDFRFIIPFMLQIGMYISPVGFSSDIMPEKWRLLYSLNPMVGVIDGFRWAISGGDFNIYVPGFCLSILLSVMAVLLGILYFRAYEKHFADVI